MLDLSTKVFRVGSGIGQQVEAHEVLEELQIRRVCQEMIDKLIAELDQRYTKKRKRRKIQNNK